jgi:hypothetical protein
MGRYNNKTEDLFSIDKLTEILRRARKKSKKKKRPSARSAAADLESVYGSAQHTGGSVCPSGPV